MIAVIFEVEPLDGKLQTYLDLAASLKADVEAHDGFISVERFESITNPGKYLSLSFFRDEAAVEAWRNRQNHRAVQGRGRDGIFKDYHLRIASVIRDYGMEDRDEAPADSQAYHGPGHEPGG